MQQNPLLTDMALHIETIHPGINVDIDTMKRIAEKLLRDSDRSHCSLSVTLVEDGYIQKLNKTYLDRDYPTDVLAFPIDEIASSHDDQETILGDIYISLDRALAQSTEYDVSLNEEVTRLLLHGIFHLLGDDHEAMAPKVDRYLQELNRV